MSTNQLALDAMPASPQPATSPWIAISERLPEPGIAVLSCYKADYAKHHVIRAKWVPAKTEESSVDSDLGEYDEADDMYYDPEGWYECIDNYCDYSAVLVSEWEITHWMPLPKPPEAT